MKVKRLEKKERGRPLKFRPDEKWGRTSVILRDWEITFLDRLAADIRESAGIAMNRSDLIREGIAILVEAQKEKRLNLEALPTDGISIQLCMLIHQSAK